MTNAENAEGSAWALRPFSVLIFLVGAVLGAGGIALLLAGGSIYYLLAGASLVVAAALLWKREPRGAATYGWFLIATLIWSLWEVGFDGWALMPRLLGPAVVGLWLLTPFARRAFRSPERLANWSVPLGIGLIVLVYAAITVSSLTRDEGQPTAYSSSSAPAQEDGEWRAYGNSAEGTRYSRLTQITPQNVGRLGRVWTYRTGVSAEAVMSPMEATPILVSDTLYMCTQTNVVIALDPETGRERWRFDPKVDRTGATFVATCRGVAYFKPPAPVIDCPERIVTTTFDARLLAVDARTGRPCRSFGDNGQVNLLKGLGPTEKGFYYASSPPAIIRGKVVVGGYVRDNDRIDIVSGVIRAFDATTGKFAWAWDMGRPGQTGEPGPGQAYTRGTPNSWAPMSADEALGLVYAPTGNSTPDHWGAHRSPVSEKFASSLVAIDAETGLPRWHFQTTHHDLWDYDVASQPTLADIPINGKRVPAVIQATKQGQIFVLDRRTGQPLTRVVEKAVPQRPLPGDWNAPTQPFSVGMPSFSGDRIRERDMWGMTPIDQLWCRLRFRKLNYSGLFTPPHPGDTLIAPGMGGGMNWGSVSVDPERGLLTTNLNIIPSVLRLIPRAEADQAIAEARKHQANQKSETIAEPGTGTPFAVTAEMFLSPLGVPCLRPPFGTINVVDLNTKKLLWSKPLGTAKASGPLGIRSGLPLTLGVPNFGGSVMTRSGLILIGASQDAMLHAYDSKTGRLLWQDQLPAGGQTTPMTYISSKSGRQFVVIVAGGSLLMQSPLGDYVVAYALPKQAIDKP
ncbi:MAG: membrane-bound PQQ-dependent dehydrogenase, glucose/quinate/shikimate family [Novosphingobium sp.]